MKRNTIYLSGIEMLIKICRKLVYIKAQRDIGVRLFFLSFFNWNIIALQFYVSFCCTMKWISYPLPLGRPYSSPLGHHWAQSWAPVLFSSFPLAILPMNTQDWSPLEWTGSPCSPRDSQESSPTPQFKSTDSSVLSFLYSPTLTSIHDHWKKHSLD